MYFGFRNNATAKIQIIFVIQQGTDIFLKNNPQKFGVERDYSYLCITKGNDFLPLKRKSSTVIGLANQFSGFLFPQVLYLSIEHRLINNGVWFE